MSSPIDKIYYYGNLTYNFNQSLTNNFFNQVFYHFCVNTTGCSPNVTFVDSTSFNGPFDYVTVVAVTTSPTRGVSSKASNDNVSGSTLIYIVVPVAVIMCCVILATLILCRSNKRNDASDNGHSILYKFLGRSREGDPHMFDFNEVYSDKSSIDKYFSPDYVIGGETRSSDIGREASLRESRASVIGRFGLRATRFFAGGYFFGEDTKNSDFDSRNSLRFGLRSTRIVNPEGRNVFDGSAERDTMKHLNTSRSKDDPPISDNITLEDLPYGAETASRRKFLNFY